MPLFRFIKDKFKIPIISNTLTLSLGSGFALAIPILIVPMLTRKYEVSDFGSYEAFLTLVSSLAAFSSLRYDYSIMLPKQDREAAQLLFLSSIVNIFYSLIAAIIVIGLSTLIIDFFNFNHELVKLVKLVPISIFLLGHFYILTRWHNRKQRYRTIAVAKILMAISIATGSFFFVYYPLQVNGLVLATLLGQFSGSFCLLFVFLKEDRQFFEFVPWRELKRGLSKYSDFPKFNLLHSISDAFQTNAMTLTIIKFWGNNVLGAYSLAIKALKAPAALLGAATCDVLYQKFSADFQANQALDQTVKKTMQVLFLVGLLPFGFLVVCAPELFVFVFGAKWEMAGRIAQLLIPWYYLNFVLAPLSTLPMVVNKQHIYLGISLAYNLLLVSLFYSVAQNFQDLYLAMTLICALTVIYELVLVQWFRTLSQQTKLKPVVEIEMLLPKKLYRNKSFIFDHVLGVQAQTSFSSIQKKSKRQELSDSELQ